MKVLWVCNLVLPQFCSELGIIASNAGGWMSQTFDKLSEHEDVTVGACALLNCKEKIKKVEYNGIQFWGIRQSKKPNWKYDIEYENAFKAIISDFNPDIVHVFGTELPHSLAAVRAFNNPKKTVIHLQGIISVISRYYNAGIPFKWINSWTVRDLIRIDNLAYQQKKFKARGKYEIETINKSGYVMGRTEWDRACSTAINPKIIYYNCNENLRKEFNEHKSTWAIDNCDRHRIFISQGNYPIKGLHIALQAIALVKRKFPDTVIYVAGDCLSGQYQLKKKMRRTTYQKYIISLIKELELEDCVFFLGSLSAIQMLHQYQKANVFLMPSTIENSPNALLEAMWVGTPIVATYVGGIPSMVSNEYEALLVPSMDYEHMSLCINKLFEDDDRAQSLSTNAIGKAEKLNDIENNINMLIKEYMQIYSSSDIEIEGIKND